MINQKENEVSNVNDKPKCDAYQKRMDEKLDVVLEGIGAICETLEDFAHRVDAIERQAATSKTK
jgi:hypothetical protein